MISEIKAIVARTSGTLPQDIAGAAALFVMLIVGLHMPGFV
jgi:hypothetical protein